MSFNEYENKELKNIIVCLHSAIEEYEVQKEINFFINYEKYKIDRKNFIKWLKNYEKEHHYELLVNSARRKLTEEEWEALEDYYNDKFHPN